MIPAEVFITTLLPDLVRVSRSMRRMVIMELTVLWETRMDEARERKLSKYVDLVKECIGNRRSMELWTVEVGCRGFTGFSVRRWIRALVVLGCEAEK